MLLLLFINVFDEKGKNKGTVSILVKYGQKSLFVFNQNGHNQQCLFLPFLPKNFMRMKNNILLTLFPINNTEKD